MANQVLIVDYSWSGTTAKMAAALQRVTDADWVSLTVAAGTFPNDMYATSEVAERQLASDHLPDVAVDLPNLDQYQSILVGGPVWSARVSTPVRSFLKQLQGYRGTVVPFYTDAGTPGDYEADFASLVTTARVVSGIGLTAGDLTHADQQLTRWWQEVNVK